MFQRLLRELDINRRDFVVGGILLINALTWFFFLISMIKEIISSSIIEPYSLGVWITFYLSLLISSVIGSILSNKISRFKFLNSWMILGVIVSLLPALISSLTLLPALVISCLFGSSFGLGIPSVLAFFADYTKVENRGRIGAITFLFANITAPFLAIPFGGLNLMTQSMVSAFWRGTGLIIFFLKPKKNESIEAHKDSFISIIRDRSFYLYFFAWLMFLLVDNFQRSIIEYNIEPDLLNTMGIVEPILGVLFILIAGFMCDWIGRKKIILSGFVALGLAYAIIGFLPNYDFSWYLYFGVDAIAWSSFSLIFILILWGDLSQHGSKEKYYTLGAIPFYLSGIIHHVIPQTLIINTDFAAAFSLASFFLFAAVMPLVFAPETLPEKNMELRRLRKFADEATKIREKYENKK